MTIINNEEDIKNITVDIAEGEVFAYKKESSAKRVGEAIKGRYIHADEKKTLALARMLKATIALQEKYNYLFLFYINMISVKKNIIVLAAGSFAFAMINAKITKKKGSFKIEESCLSLDGVRPCTGYKEIELDHVAGIVI